MCPNSLRGGTPPGLFTAGVSLRTPRINPEGEEEGGRRWVVEGVAPGRVPRHRWGQPSGSPVQSPLGLPFCSSATIGWPTGSVSGRSPPHPPLSFDPRGSREAWALGGPKKGLSGTPCGAKPRGGGGAPPTNLILLRNQRTPVRVRRTRRSRGTPGTQHPPPGASRGVSPGPPTSRGVSASPPARHPARRLRRRLAGRLFRTRSLRSRALRAAPRAPGPARLPVRSRHAPSTPTARRGSLRSG